MSESIVPAFDVGALALSPAEKEKYTALSGMMQGANTGLEGETARDWRPATVKVVQPVTQDAAKPIDAKNGDLFTRGGAIESPLRGVVTNGWYSRVRFAPGDNRPSCSSENVDIRGRGKDDKSVSVYGQSCAQCPYNDQPFTAGKKSNCNNVINISVVPENLENVLHLQFTKSSYKTGQQLLSLLNATNPIWKRFYEFNAEAMKREKGGGVYYVWHVAPNSTVEVPEHLKAFAEYVSTQMKTKRDADRTRIREIPQQVETGLSKAALDTVMDVTGTSTYKDDM